MQTTETIAPDFLTRLWVQDFTVWLAQRLDNPSPLLSSEHAEYVRWIKCRGAHPLCSRALWWRTLTALLGESRPMRIGGRTTRARVVPSLLLLDKTQEEDAS